MSEESKNLKVCCFCGLAEDNELEFGQFYEHNGIVTHYYCLLLSSKMEQKGNDNEGILGFLINDIKKELRRGKRLLCYYCKKSGATLGCCNIKCKRTFHYPCGLRAGTLNQFFGEFRSYCINHRPQQKVEGYLGRISQKHNDSFCYICYDKIDLHDLIGTLWAPCCKKDAWFHRKCVQQLAMNAGYFFKCPLCNNNKEFQNEMLEYGIYIPSQDASWELEPNAFQELLYRHNRCDAVTCLCPKGRNHTSMNAKWELALCRTCGSQGIHMACGQLKWAKPVWNCDECISILGKVKKSDNFVSETINITHHDTDVDSSDSEISVGGTQNTDDSPISYLYTRPGPLSFKLQRAKANKSTIRIMCEDDLASSTQNCFMTSSPVVSSSLNLQSTENTDKDNICLSSKDENVSETNWEQSLQCTQQSISTVAINQTDMHKMDNDDDDDVQIVSSSTSKKMTRASCGNRTKTTNLNQSVDMSCKASTSFGVHRQATSDKMPNIMNNRLSIENKKRKSDNIEATQKTVAAVVDNTEIIMLSSIKNHVDKDNSPVGNINIKDQYPNKGCLTLNDPPSVRDLENANNNTISSINSNSLTNLPSSEESEIKNKRSKSLETQCNELQSRSKRKYETNICTIGTHINENEIVLTDKCKKIKGNGIKENINDPCSTSTCNIANLKDTDMINKQSLQKEIRNENLNMDQQTESSYSVKNNLSNRNSNIHILPSILKMTNHNIADGKLNNNQSLIPDISRDEDVTDVLYNNTFKSVTIGTSGTFAKIIQSPNLDDVEIQSRKRSIKTQCAGDADTRSTGESTDTYATTERDWINPEGESTTTKWAKLLHCTAHRKRVSDKDYISSSPKTKICSAFSEIASNPNTCDKPRLIPKSIPLQDLKFKVRDSNNLQMILYDTFSVNITMNTIIKNHAKDPSTSTGVCNMENALLYLDDKSTVPTCSRIQHSCTSHLTSNKSKRTADTGVSKNVIKNHADVKENFNSVMKIPFVNVSNNFSIINVFDDKCPLMTRSNQMENDTPVNFLSARTRRIRVLRYAQAVTR